jgi:hypothetical protein
MHIGHSLTSTFALFFLEHTSGRYYIRFALFVKDYRTINLKKFYSRFFGHAGRCVTVSFALSLLKNAKIISCPLLEDHQCDL